MPQKKIFAQTMEEAHEQLGHKQATTLIWKHCTRCREKWGEVYEEDLQGGCGLCRDEGGWYEERRILH